MAMRFTKVYQVRKALPQPWDGERPNDTVLGLCACVRKEMRGSWPLSPAKWDLGGRDPVSFRLDTNTPMCSWEVENLSRVEVLAWCPCPAAITPASKGAGSGVWRWTSWLISAPAGPTTLLPCLLILAHARLRQASPVHRNAVSTSWAKAVHLTSPLDALVNS